MLRPGHRHDDRAGARTQSVPHEGGPPMTDTITKPKFQDEIKVERPRLHKVILVNDDFTPHEFVVTVLKVEFRMTKIKLYG
jgi:ATP-dependent Clp protease adaptor protein ClpS